MLSIYRKNGVSIIALGFWILAILIFCNVNGITFLLTGKLGLISPILILGCALIFLYLRVNVSDFSRGSTYLILTISCLFLLGLLPALYFQNSTNFQFSFLQRAFRDTVTSVLILSVFYLVFKRQKKSEQFKYLVIIFYFFLFTTIIGALEPILGYRDYFVLDKSTSRRLGFFGNPNETGLQACYTLVMALGLFMLKRIRLIFVLPIVLVSVYTAISSFSKTAMLNVSLILVYYIAYSLLYGPFKIHRQITKRNFAFIATVVCLFLFVLLPNVMKVYNNLDTAQRLRIDSFTAIVFEGELTEKTTSERSEILPEAVEYIKSNPFFGYGVGTFSNGGMFSSNHTVGVHNTYFRIYLESGLITLLLFFAFIYRMFSDLRFIKEPGLVFLSSGCVLVYLVFCLTDHTALHQKLSIALLGILLAINWRYRNETSELTKSMSEFGNNLS